MTISEYHIFVILPEILSLAAVVYDAHDTETGSFTSPTTAFAVYFGNSTGRIVFTATAPADIQYFAFKIPSNWVCSSYYLSSAPVEGWMATDHGGNFTLGNLQ
jgi:hypothetical protein